MLLATARLLDSVWTLEYEIEDEKVRIISYGRDNQAGYDQEESLPRVRVRENEHRTVLGVWIAPFNRFENFASRQRGQYYEVSNPQYIFSYERT